MLLESLRRERDELFDELLEKGYKEQELIKCCQGKDCLTVNNYYSIQSKFNGLCNAVKIAERREYEFVMARA